jgi:hypothetical protein
VTDNVAKVRHSAAEALATLRTELRRPLSELVAFAGVGVVFQYWYLSGKLKRSQFATRVPYDVGIAEARSPTD